MKAEEFYQKLSEVPDLPDIFPQIETTLQRRRNIRRYVLAVAAALTMTISLISYIQFNFQSETKNEIAYTAQELPLEITEELQIISDFFDGSTIDEEMSIYASIDINEL